MTPSEARRVIAAAPPRAPSRSVLVCEPVGYRIAYAINPHMRDAEGRLKSADQARAREQWEGLRATYERLGIAVTTITGSTDLPDMVFCANPALPFVAAGGERAVLLSNMHAPERRGEVPAFETFFKSMGYGIRRLSREDAGSFEGHGDLLWHPERRVLFGGYGFRTTERALALVAEEVGVPVIPLRLVDPRFYHLDTCFMPLGRGCALLYEAALDAEARAIAASTFEDVISPPEREAAEALACNATCLDGRNVVIDAACASTSGALARRGFEVHRVDTSEFLKAGGSVFCMTLTLP